MAATLTYRTDCGTFSFASLYRSSISSKPVRDDAGWTVVAVEHTLDVVGYVTAPVGTTMAQAREDLNTSGGHLTYLDKGFDIEVNAAGSTVRDVAWGPHPQVLDFTPLGGDCNAARVHWRVTTRIPECCEAVSSVRRLMAVNFEVSYSIDECGYNTEQVSGYIEIPMTRRSPGDRVPPDCVDLYTEEVLGRRPPAAGFRRKGQTRKVSKDRRRLDFSWSDEEMPSPLPRKVGDIQCTHECETTLRQGFRTWVISLDASIKMARGVPKSEALKVFFKLIETKRPGRGSVPPGARTLIMFLPQRFKVSDDVFGKGSRFSLQATYVQRGPVWAFLLSSKLWDPIEGENYEAWRASMQEEGASRPTGGANLLTRAGEALIVDLCLSGKPATPGESAAKPPPAPRRTDVRDKDDPVKPPKPPSDESWLRYENRLRYRETPNRARHRPLPSSPRPDPGRIPGSPPPRSPEATDDAGRLDGFTGAHGPAMSQDGRPRDVFQEAASPGGTIVLEGYGVRYGHRVPVPHLKNIGGVPAVEMGRETEETSYEASLGVPLFRTDWVIEYALPELPSGALPTTGNPFLGTDGDKAGAPTDLEGVTF